MKVITGLGKRSSKVISSRIYDTIAELARPDAFFSNAADALRVAHYLISLGLKPGGKLEQNLPAGDMLSSNSLSLPMTHRPSRTSERQFRSICHHLASMHVIERRSSVYQPRPHR